MILTGCSLLEGHNSSQNYYKYAQELPLSIGNSWVYRVTRFDGFNSNDIMTATYTQTDSVARVESKNGFYVATIQSEHTGETLVDVQGDYPAVGSLQPAITQTYWLIVDGDRVLRQDGQLNLSDLQSHVLVQFVFPLSLNSQWSIYNAKDAPLNRKVTKVGSITVPAGTFTDCFYLEGEIGGMTFDDWFCPGIGVAWSNVEHHGTPYGNRQELLGYQFK